MLPIARMITNPRNISSPLRARRGWGALAGIAIGLLVATSTRTIAPAAEITAPPKIQAETQKARLGKSLGPVVGAPPDGSPERVFLALTAEPATSQAVSWRSAPTTGRLQAALVRAPAGPIQEKIATLVPAEVERVPYSGGRIMCQASVLFTNLQPATPYAYRVGDGKTWSEWHQFRTAAAQPAPFRFLYVGDLQNGILSQGSRVLRQAVLKAPDARFVVHAGDLVTHPFDDRLWFEWYAAGGWTYAALPSVLTPGNHDVGSRAADKVWRPQFNLPRNGPPGQEELTYFLDYQGLRLIVFNGNDYQNPAQLQWLAMVLATKPGGWTIVVMHQPLYATGKGRASSSSKRRQVLMPLLEAGGVDLVLQGHDHSYGRTQKIRAGQVVGTSERGVVYATSVSGPKMYKLNQTYRPLMARLATDRQLFQVLSVADDGLRYEAYTADGELFDAFDLRRQNSATELVERAPK